jgi:hypothetical protein
MSRAPGTEECDWCEHHDECAGRNEAMTRGGRKAHEQAINRGIS